MLETSDLACIIAMVSLMEMRGPWPMHVTLLLSHGLRLQDFIYSFSFAVAYPMHELGLWNMICNIVA